MTRFAIRLAAASLLTACAGDPEPGAMGGSESADGADDGSGDGGSADDDGSADGDGGDGADGGSDGETGGEPPFEPIPARGITVTGAEINQGVAIPIAVDGSWVEGAARNAQIVPGRHALFRYYWELDADFEPRELEARFTYTVPGAEPEVASTMEMISMDSAETSLMRSLWWVLPPEMVVPGAEFEFEIYEAGPGYEDTPEPDPPPRAVDEAGSHLVGIEQAEQTLRVHVVRVEHHWQGDVCTVPSLTDPILEAIRDRLHAQYPTTTVEVTARADPLVWTESMSSYDPILVDLSQLRSADSTDPSQYYYGLIRPCDGGQSGTGGSSLDIPDWPEQANVWGHTALSWWYSSGYNEELVVHEMGHLLGRRHVVCNGEEAAPDPNFPYGDGIGTWGFDISSWDLHNPEGSTDYMSYCYQTNWVSDYGWSKVYPFIKEVTSWDGGAPVEPPEELLVGAVDENGIETWFVTPGRADGFPPSQGFAEFTVGGTLARRPMHVRPRAHGGQLRVVSLAGLDADGLTAVRWGHGGLAGTVDPASIRNR